VKSRCKFPWPSVVKVLPCKIGYAYHIKKKGEWVPFAYVWASKPGSPPWWRNLFFMTDANEINMLQLIEKLRKGKTK